VRQGKPFEGSGNDSDDKGAYPLKVLSSKGFIFEIFRLTTLIDWAFAALLAKKSDRPPDWSLQRSPH